MKATVLEEYRKIVWKEKAIPEIKSNEVLVKVTYAGICGSDQHIPGSPVFSNAAPGIESIRCYLT